MGYKLVCIQTPAFNYGKHAFRSYTPARAKIAYQIFMSAERAGISRMYSKLSG